MGTRSVCHPRRLCSTPLPDGRESDLKAPGADLMRMVEAMSSLRRRLAPKRPSGMAIRAAQATRGEAAFDDHCRSCHRGGFFQGFIERWREDKLSGFFNFISTRMPRDNPGSASLLCS